MNREQIWRERHKQETQELDRRRPVYLSGHEIAVVQEAIKRMLRQAPSREEIRLLDAAFEKLSWGAGE